MMTAAKSVKEDICAMMWASHAELWVCLMSGGISYRQDVLECSNVELRACYLQAVNFVYE